jgi:Flp pilus assembly CpaF family ATPase
LERTIEELSTGQAELPPDDFQQTDLGNQIAGELVRARIVRCLIERSGLTVESLRGSNERSGWQRLRTLLHEREQELEAVVLKVQKSLHLERSNDLSEQMKLMEDEFWAAWETARRDLPPRTRRYMALQQLKKDIKDIWYGFGPLEDLLDNPAVTEIMVNDKDHIFIERGNVIENSGRRFLSDDDTERIIRKIVSSVNRRIDTSEPMVDARMFDGSRINAVLPPLAVRGPSLTIRRFPKRRLTIDDLVALGSLTAQASAFLRAAVVCRRNLLISGGTGTGKTTLLNCLSGFIPDKERIVTIEDTAELQLQKEHVVSLEARPKNTEGAGGVTIRDLVRNALRMRPDRIVVGECRGGEALDMLQAMNTGHDGSLTTIHANSPADVVLRLEVMVQQNAETRLPVESIHRQIISAIDLILQLETVTAGNEKKKVVTEIAEVLEGEQPGSVWIKPLFRRQNGSLCMTGYLGGFLEEVVLAGLVPGNS